MSDIDVIIVGGGLAGISCAVTLHKKGVWPLVLEASDDIGGRVRTDFVEGYLLDRGAQVLLTAYPEAQRMLDYSALDLRYYEPGALVRFGGSFHHVVDPWRRPLKIEKSIATPIGTFSDKLKTAFLRRRTLKGDLSDIYSRPETSTFGYLVKAGLSDSMIDRFFRPFLGSIFFDTRLDVSSRVFEFGFRMFSEGESALPAKGIGEIPKQLASRIPEECIRTDAHVASLNEKTVILESGESLTAKRLVIATGGHEAARLLGQKTTPEARGMVCMQFAAEASPLPEPLLVLNGDNRGPVCSLSVPSLLTSKIVPAGRELITVTVLGDPEEDDEELKQAVREQLVDWFGPIIREWQHLRTLRIPHALPLQIPPVEDPVRAPVRISRNLFICGEHRSTASFQWAMVSGRRAAEAVVRSFQE